MQVQWKDDRGVCGAAVAGGFPGSDAALDSGRELPSGRGGADNSGRGHNGRGTLAVPTLGDRRVEPPETFTVTVPEDTLIEIAEATAERRIKEEDNDTRHRRGSEVWG